MSQLDLTSLLLVLLIALGIFSNNLPVTVAVSVLLLFRVLHVQPVFPFLEKYGLTIGILLLTIAVISPIASGKIQIDAIWQSFTHWKSLIAIAVGIGVAYLGGRGVSLMSAQPTVVTGLLIGTIIGVAFFKGVPVGPLIAAGILSLIIGRT